LFLIPGIYTIGGIKNNFNKMIIIIIIIIQELESHQMERRQLCLVFIDEVKQVGFKASFECGEGR